MNYYNGKTKSSAVPCHIHTDAQGKPLPCNMDECKEVACNYRDWQKNGSDEFNGDAAHHAMTGE